MFPTEEIIYYEIKNNFLIIKTCNGNYKLEKKDIEELLQKPETLEEEKTSIHTYKPTYVNEKGEKLSRWELLQRNAPPSSFRESKQESKREFKN